MRTLKVDDKPYSCEAISEIKWVGGYYNCTFTGPDRKCLKLFNRMLESGKVKEFRVNTLYGKYKGTFQVLQIDSSRVCIVRFLTFTLKSPSS